MHRKEAKVSDRSVELLNPENKSFVSRKSNVYVYVKVFMFYLVASKCTDVLLICIPSFLPLVYKIICGRENDS